MLNEFMDLLGRPINDPYVKDFIENKQLKYPKKDIYAQNSDAESIQIYGKKVGKVLLFNRKVDEYEFVLNFKPRRWNPQYPEVPAEKGGTFYYILDSIEFCRTLEIELLRILKIPSKQTTPDELFKIIGKRKQTKHGNYNWIIPINQEKDICASVNYYNDEVSASIEIPKRPLFSNFPVQEFNEVLGKPINLPEVKAFIEKYNGIYPKKQTIDTTLDPSTVKANISNEVEEQYYTINIAAGSIGLCFGLQKQNEKYFPLPAKKANHFYPILNKITLHNFYDFNDEDNIIYFPNNVKSDDCVHTIIEKWGEPHRGSLEEGFYCWQVVVDKNNDFVIEVFYSTKDEDLHTSNKFYGIELNIKLNIHR